MAILDRAFSALNAFRRQSENHRCGLDSARDVTGKFPGSFRDELDSILRDVELETEVEPNAVVAGRRTKFKSA